MFRSRVSWLIAFMLGLAVTWTPASGLSPADLVGTWTWSWKDGQGTMHKHVLKVEKTGGKLMATETFDDQPAVNAAELKVEGKKVSFSVLREKRTSTYSGNFASDDTINGTASVDADGQVNEYAWTAKREPKGG